MDENKLKSESYRNSSPGRVNYPASYFKPPGKSRLGNKPLTLTHGNLAVVGRFIPRTPTPRRPSPKSRPVVVRKMTYPKPSVYIAPLARPRSAPIAQPVVPVATPTIRSTRSSAKAKVQKVSVMPSGVMTRSMSKAKKLKVV
jgi:hypothetical protein